LCGYNDQVLYMTYQIINKYLSKFKYLKFLSFIYILNHNILSLVMILLCCRGGGGGGQLRDWRVDDHHHNNNNIVTGVCGRLPRKPVVAVRGPETASKCPPKAAWWEVFPEYYSVWKNQKGGSFRFWTAAEKASRCAYRNRAIRHRRGRPQFYIFFFSCFTS